MDVRGTLPSLPHEYRHLSTVDCLDPSPDFQDSNCLHIPILFACTVLPQLLHRHSTFDLYTEAPVAGLVVPYLILRFIFLTIGLRNTDVDVL